MQPRKLRNAYLLFLMIFLLQRQRALLFQQLYHFLITEEEFRVRRTNVSHDLGPNETAKRATLMKERSNRVSCACLQSKGIFHCSLIDVSIS